MHHKLPLEELPLVTREIVRSLFGKELFFGHPVCCVPGTREPRGNIVFILATVSGFLPVAWEKCVNVNVP